MYKLNQNFALGIILGFVIATVVGTISHEYGHIIVAKYLGYETTLHYNMMSYHKDPSYLDPIVRSSLSPQSYEDLKILRKKEIFLITLGGPIQTILIGLIGFFILWIRRNLKNHFGLKDWIAVLLTFFLARQIFNFGNQMLRYLISGKIKISGDEMKLAHYLEWPIYSIAFFSCIFSIFICCITVFVFIPKSKMIWFILYGIMGCILGYITWMIWLGPILLPVY